jgi:uncharacterized protein YndB with AHSA1/START domain
MFAAAPYTTTFSTPSDREIAMSRTFDAPRALVWDAHTRPEHVREWLLGPPGWTMPVCEIDLRVGGAYRYVWRDAAGAEMGMGGVYQEVAAPARLVATERFDEPWYAGDAVDTLVLVEEGGRTTLTQTVRYASREVRDLVLASPMRDGVAASFERLAEYLAAAGAAS